MDSVNDATLQCFRHVYNFSNTSFSNYSILSVMLQDFLGIKKYFPTI